MIQTIKLITFLCFPGGLSQNIQLHNRRRWENTLKSKAQLSVCRELLILTSHIESRLG